MVSTFSLADYPKGKLVHGADDVGIGVWSGHKMFYQLMDKREVSPIFGSLSNGTDQSDTTYRNSGAAYFHGSGVVQKPATRRKSLDRDRFDHCRSCLPIGRHFMDGELLAETDHTDRFYQHTRVFLVDVQGNF
jgi:hypothetical protein